MYRQILADPVHTQLVWLIRSGDRRMDFKDLGYPLREAGGEPFLYTTATVVKDRCTVQNNQQTHMRPPENGWREARVLIDSRGQLVMNCDNLRFVFRSIADEGEKIDEIECTMMDGSRILLDAKSKKIIRCIESQVEGNMKRFQPIKKREQPFGAFSKSKR